MLIEVTPPCLHVHVHELCGRQSEVKFVGMGNCETPPNKEVASITHLSTIHWVMNPFTCSYNSKCWSGKMRGCGGKLGLAGPRSSHQFWYSCLGLRTRQHPTSQVVHIAVVADGDPTKCSAFPWCGHTLRKTLSTTGQMLMPCCPQLGRSASCSWHGECTDPQQGKVLAKLKNRRLVFSICVFLS